MSRYLKLRGALEDGESPTLRVGGSSMEPVIKNGSTLTWKKTDDYQIGDIVFCKVGKNWIDAHRITKIASDGRYMISNNKGWDNGWTRKIFGRVIAVNGIPFGRAIESPGDERDL